MIPLWLHVLSLVSLSLAILCAVWIAFDCWRRPQKMGVMNAVWPLCALFGSVPLLWFFLRYGREGTSFDGGFAVSVGKGALHCGSGCTLGDILAETLAVTVPAVLVPLGYPGLFGTEIFAVWILDYIFAFAIGIIFQYYAIAPMQGLGLKEGIIAALRADTLSLTSWQIGMYGLMALASFWLFPAVFDTRISPTMPIFWFVMQFAMMAGFLTAYPVNWWLIRKGWKEEM